MESEQEIKFEDTAKAYALKTNAELSLAKMLFSVLQSKGLSGFGRKFLKFSIGAKLPVDGALKATLFKQFIGGESIKDTQPLISKLSKYGVQSILDYSLEGIESESEFEKAVNEFLANVEFAAANQNVPFSVFKPSAIATHKILALASSEKALSEAEAAAFEKVRVRFHTIFKRAAELGVRVMIDAEESWIQPAIDKLALEMMTTYNKEKVIAFNTYQMYRHDRLAYLETIFQLAKQQGFKPGTKLVRGAYMEKERERAYSLSYPSPIYPDKLSCDQGFDKAVEMCIQHIDIGEVFIGTHNEDSVKKAIHLMHNKGLANDSQGVWFSQLYGMCDYISFNLGDAGYQVAKYIPYGPVKAVIPYLLRRADENSSVTGQASKELRLIKEEVKRRKIED